MGRVVGCSRQDPARQSLHGALQKRGARPVAHTEAFTVLGGSHGKVWAKEGSSWSWRVAGWRREARVETETLAEREVARF